MLSCFMKTTPAACASAPSSFEAGSRFETNNRIAPGFTKNTYGFGVICKKVSVPTRKFEGLSW
jgi:hypothetical protein